MVLIRKVRGHVRWTLGVDQLIPNCISHEFGH